MKKAAAFISVLLSATADAYGLQTEVFGNSSLILPGYISGSLELRSEIIQAQDADIKSLGNISDSIKRQRRCVNAGYSPCPNIAGRCCPTGDSCFANGCCDAGFIPCGTRKCYNPQVSKCCRDGYACELGYDCVGNGYCCPSGQQLCRNTSCYNSKSETCCANGGTCPVGDNCLDGGCCPKGSIRCGNSKCYYPSSSTCCTSPGKVWGCPLNEKCCTLGGATACVDPSTQQCCPGGSCPKESTCCGDRCCKLGSTCGSDGYCTSKSTTISRASSSKLISSSYTSTSAATCTVARQGSDVRFDYTTLSKRFPAKCQTEFDECGKEIPVWTITYKKNSADKKDTDALVRSMCQGINDRRRRLANVLHAFPEEIDTDYVTYRGGGRGNGTEKRVRCRDFCKNCDKNAPERWSCDEYPPATFKESAPETSLGESFSSRVCIPSSQNSRQGGFLSALVKRCLTKGNEQKVKIRIEGVPGGCRSLEADAGCGQPSQIKRLKTKKSDVEVVQSSSDVMDLFGDGTQFAVAIDLGEVTNGTHRYAVATNTSVDYIALVANDGYEYAAQDASGGLSATFDFTVDSTEELTLWAFLYDDQSVNLTYIEKDVQTSAARKMVNVGVGYWLELMAMVLLGLYQFTAG